MKKLLSAVLVAAAFCLGGCAENPLFRATKSIFSIQKPARTAMRPKPISAENILA